MSVIEKAGEALALLIQDVKDGEASMGPLIDRFYEFPQPLEDSADKARVMSDRLLGTQLSAENAKKGMKNLSDEFVANTIPQFDIVNERAATLKHILEYLEGKHTVRLDFKTTGSMTGEAPAPVTGMQHGGVVPGPIGSKQLIVAEGGERFLGAPGTPEARAAGSGGPTYNYTYNVSDRMALALIEHQQRVERFQRLDSRM